MKKMEKIIILIMLIIVISIIIITLLLKNGKKSEKDEISTGTASHEEQLNEENRIKKIDSNQDYFDVKDCIENYKKISSDWRKAKNNSDEQRINDVKQKIESIIPSFVTEKMDKDIYEEVILKEGIVRIDNIYKSVQTINEEEYKESTNICVYIVNGVLLNSNASENESFKIILILDMNNLTYYVVPEIYIEKQNISIDEGKSLNIYNEKSIENKEYNTFSYTSINDQDICKEYLSRLKLNIKYDLQTAYNELNEEYRNKRFSNIDDFKQYITNNNLGDVELSKYKVNRYDEYSEYICLDQSGNYITFKAENVINYSVILDTYTINSNAFVEKYNKGNEQVKVGMNIEKVIEALNGKDYKYIYNKLDDSFKENNFNNTEKFEAYMKKQFFNKNKAEYLEFSKEGNIYIYKINVCSTEENNEEVKSVTIIMKLLEDTDFVISFNIEE